MTLYKTKKNPEMNNKKMQGLQAIKNMTKTA